MPSCSDRIAEVERASFRPGIGPTNAADGLRKIPGVGPDRRGDAADEDAGAQGFRSARQFAAWIGLTPKDHSTGGKVRLGVITRAGDEDLRSVLVVGATSLLRQFRAGRGRDGVRCQRGSINFSSASRPSWSPWHWPTR